MRLHDLSEHAKFNVHGLALCAFPKPLLLVVDNLRHSEVAKQAVTKGFPSIRQTPGSAGLRAWLKVKKNSAPRQNLWVEVGALVRSKEKDSASCPDPVWVVLSQNPMQGGTGCS